MVRLGGGEHGFLLRLVTGTVRDDPSRQEEPGRVSPADGHGERREVSGFKSGACGQDTPEFPIAPVRQFLAALRAGLRPDGP